MTHPNPTAEPDTTLDAATPGATGAPGTAGKPARKAPRRATAAAGAPASVESSTPAILVIDANGMMVPTPVTPVTPEIERPAQAQDTSDTGKSPAVDAAPLEVAESAVAKPEPVEAEAVESEVVESRPVDSKSVDTAATADTPSPASGSLVASPEDSKLESEPESAPKLEPEPESEPKSESEPEPESESEPEPAPSDSLPSMAAADEGDTPSTTVEAVAEVTPVSLSRRERRLAEQQDENNTTSAAVATTVAEGTDSGSLTSESSASTEEPAPDSGRTNPGKPPRKRNSFVTFFRGLFFLVVISALVVAMGTVLSGPEVNAGDQSPTQLQRQAAWEATTKLQGEALNLADASSTPQLQKALSITATNLGLQASALSDGLPTEAPTATGPASEPTPMTFTGFIQELSANAEALLNNALSADHSMGRVFASVGTSQLLQSAELASVAGITVPTSAHMPAPVDFPSASGPSCTSTLEPRPGVTVDSALSAAAEAEQKAIYAYQAASTRFTEPQFSKATTLLARHRQKLKLLNAELRLRCLPLAEPVAGFTLDSTFTTLPKQALSILETQLSSIYGELAALSTAPGADQSPNTTEPAAPASSTPESVATESKATPLPLNGSNLREMAVLWLLDSTQAHTFWGGSVEALPGIAPSIAPEPVIASVPAR
ncbi:DUF4439 domain-containing protein [Specibacter sp. NPDC078692]|uniref:DUF4439 domain-containing protein n=1 Tax=Specibacter sp. NPDC078692 TaxID=3155818 RepID=UPI0034498874